VKSVFSGTLLFTGDLQVIRHNITEINNKGNLEEKVFITNLD